jgi:arylsulfatase A-like enzyme
MIRKSVFFLLIILIYQSKISAQSNNIKPNVLFIICDDLNDYQGVSGGHPQAKTPNIDRLAASGVQFINAQSNVPVCSPSRNSLITGVYPHISKDYGWTDLKKQPVLKNNKTIMRYFKENGYTTLGTGKITHGNVKNDWDEWGMSLKNNYGPFYFDGKDKKALPTVPKPFADIGQVDGSFGRLSSVISPGKKGEKGWVYGWDNKPMRYINDNDRDLMQDELHAKWAVKKLKELEKREKQKPFFMGIGFVRPHTPMHAPDKYFDLFPIEDLKLDTWKKNDKKDTHWAANFDANLKGTKYYRLLLESYNGDREIALKHFLQAYLACVAFVDEQVGKVLEGLENSKFKNNTIVVFTSDHGWQMGEKDYIFKNSPWEESTRIPMIIKMPNGKAGKKIKHPVSLIDLFPTLKELCNLTGNHKINEKGAEIGGFSLKPFLDCKPRKWKGPNGALSVVGNYGVKIPTEKQNFSYRTQNWRYIRYSNGQEELYNHKNDSYEWTNLAENKKYKKIKNKLEKEMNAIIFKTNL